MLTQNIVLFILYIKIKIKVGNLIYKKTILTAAKLYRTWLK